jgi:hypothetical protein
MPPFAWQHVFLFGKQLPRLQGLQLSHCPALGVFAAANLFSCCTNLQKLELPPLECDPVMVLAPICRLRGLQRLVVPGANLNDAAVKQLAQLTGLVELSIACTDGNSVTDIGLLPLTALRQLQSLRVTAIRTDYKKPYGPGSTYTHWFRTSVSQDYPPNWLTHGHYSCMQALTGSATSLAVREISSRGMAMMAMGTVHATTADTSDSPTCDMCAPLLACAAPVSNPCSIQQLSASVCFFAASL